VLQKALIRQAAAVFGPVRSCGEGEVVHAGAGLDGVEEAVAALSAVAEDLVLLHAGEGVLDACANLAMLRVSSSPFSNGRPGRLRSGTISPVLM
jgi:hypothetical protein